MIYVHVIASVFNRIFQMGSSFIGCIGIFTAVESDGLWNHLPIYFALAYVSVSWNMHCAHFKNILWYWYFNFIVAIGFFKNFFKSQHKLSQHNIRFRFQIHVYWITFNQQDYGIFPCKL